MAFGESCYQSKYTTDRQSVRDLVEFERYCRDYELWEEMYPLYADDSKVRITWYEGSGKGFVDASKKMQGARHKINNTIVSVNQDKAFAVVLAQIQSRKTICGITSDLISYVRLYYRIIKVHGEWKIYTIDCVYEQDSIVPAVPGTVDEINSETLKKFRPSYCCLSYVLDLMGKAVNQELPGDDQPEKVRNLEKKIFDWIKN